MIHELKQLPNFFQDVISGKKTFEVRKNDRPFHEGDLLALNEYIPEEKRYTGNSCLVFIDYILNDEQYCKKDYVVMSIKPCSIYRHNRPFSEFKLDKDYSVPYATRESEK